LFSNTVGVAESPTWRRALALTRCDVIRKEAKYLRNSGRLVRNVFDGRSLRRPHESPHILYIFLESKIIRLHFCRWRFVSIVIQIFLVGAKRRTFPPFKVIQGRWIWHQSKARMRLPISP